MFLIRIFFLFGVGNLVKWASESSHFFFFFICKEKVHKIEEEFA